MESFSNSSINIMSNKGNLLKGNKLSNNDAIGINEMWCLWKLVGTY
jgi:hypothetical protein